MQALIVTLYWCVTVFSYITLSLISIPWSFLHNHLSISSLGVTLKREEREEGQREGERDSTLPMYFKKTWKNKRGRERKGESVEREKGKKGRKKRDSHLINIYCRWHSFVKYLLNAYYMPDTIQTLKIYSNEQKRHGSCLYRVFRLAGNAR